MGMRAVVGIRTAMARAATGACALALACGLAGCALATPALSEVTPPELDPKVSAPAIIEDGVLTVALDTTNAPQAMNDASGNATGYYVDVARALAERMGLKLRTVSAASAKSALEDGEADIFIGADERDAAGDIAVLGSLGEDAPAVFAELGEDKDASSVSAENLQGAPVAVQGSSASQDALARAGISASLSEQPNVNKCFDALETGAAEYVACDATAGSYLARAIDGVELVGTIGATTTAGIAVTEGGDLASALEEALDAIEADGTLDALHAYWYGTTPLVLSDKTLDGVTLKTDGEKASGDAAAGDDGSADDAEGMISEDINSLG